MTLKQFNYSGHEESKLMAQEYLDEAVRNMKIEVVAAHIKCPDVDINRIIDGTGTTLDQVLIRWVNDLYDSTIVFLEFIYRLNILINIGASFSDELDSTLEVGSPRDISSFTQPTDIEYAVKAYKRRNVIFINIRNARLKIGKLLESEAHDNERLFCSHFNINGNKGYAQKNYNTGMRNYVVYRGCINMRASWSVISYDKNGYQITKKESINIYIKDDGTVRLSKQDKLRYEKREINFYGCRVLIGGHRLEDILSKKHWLYSDNQIFYDSEYFSREASPERKISTFSSNNSDLLNPDTCKIDQENNENLSTKNTDVEQNQLLDSKSDLLTNSYGSSEFYDVIDRALQNLQSMNLDKNDVAEIEEENRKVEEENKIYLKKLKSNRLYAQFNKEQICTYEQQTTIACDISVDNNQMSSKCSNQKNSVIASNNDQYCEDMEMDKKTLAVIDNNTVPLQEKINLLLSGRGSYSHGNDITVSDAISNSQEPDRSSANGLSWDNNTLELGLDDVELDYNFSRRTRFFNCKQRSSSVPTRLSILREAPGNSLDYNLNELFVRPTITVTCPKAKHSISSELDTPCEALDNNPSYNLNKSCIYSIVQDPNENIIKLGMFLT